MAKTQKYSEDQLLEAVIKYSEIEKKKIKATELAKWCRNNLEGLEEVRDYHFTRTKKQRDEKTGKMVERRKLCTIKMEEINKSRSLTININTNLLLKASNIDVFMEQPDSLKRKMVIETRETVDKLLIRNGNIERENEVLKAENKSVKSDILKMEHKLKELQNAQNRLIKQVSYLMKATDESVRKEMLSQMGITDNSVDLMTYTNSLQQNLNEIMDINRTLRGYVSINSDGETKIAEDNEKKLSDTIMSGLTF